MSIFEVILVLKVILSKSSMEGFRMGEVEMDRFAG